MTSCVTEHDVLCKEIEGGDWSLLLLLADWYEDRRQDRTARQLRALASKRKWPQQTGRSEDDNNPWFWFWWKCTTNRKDSNFVSRMQIGWLIHNRPPFLKQYTSHLVALYPSEHAAVVAYFRVLTNPKGA